MTEWTMPFYRFYLLTAKDHIARRREADCDNDAHAIAKVAELIENYSAVEIWNDGRRIIRLATEDIPLPQDKLAMPP
jgi:hypothetical protein